MSLFLLSVISGRIANWAKLVVRFHVMVTAVHSGLNPRLNTGTTSESPLNAFFAISLESGIRFKNLTVFEKEKYCILY
jgi:hypothetical protein